MKIYINDILASRVDVLILNARLQDGRETATAKAYNGSIYYTTWR